MPNHTDVKAMFYGPAEAITKMRQSQRLRGVQDEKLFAFARSKEAADGAVYEVERDFGERDVLVESMPSKDFGLLPAVDGGECFSFEDASPMPASLHMSSDSMAEMAEKVLRGEWRSLGNYHGMEKVAAAKTREEAVALMESTHPGLIAEGQARIDNVEKYGHADWYGWSVEHWGTKWNAYEVSWREPKHGGQSCVVSMQTAWSPPMAALVASCKKYGLRCSCYGIDEGGGFSYVADLSADGIESEEESRTKRGLESIQAKHFKAWKDGLGEPSAQEKKSSLAARKVELAAWPARALAGVVAGDKGHGAGAPAPHSPSVVDGVFAAVGEGSLLNARLAEDLVVDLARRGVLSPEDKASNGMSFGELATGGLWAEGARWAIQHAKDEKKRGEWISILRAAAVQANDPKSFALSLALDPSWMVKNETKLPPACRIEWIQTRAAREQVRSFDALRVEVELAKDAARQWIRKGLQEAIDLLPKVSALREAAELASQVKKAPKAGSKSAL